jgi:hypothetical protein
MILSHQSQFIFIKTAKVGGTNLELYLNQYREKNNLYIPHWMNEKNYWNKCISRYHQSKLIYEANYKIELSFQNCFDFFSGKLALPWETQAWGSEAPYNWPRFTDLKSNSILVNHIIRYEKLEILYKKWAIPFKNFNQIRSKNNSRPAYTSFRKFFIHEKEPYIEKITFLFKSELSHFNYSF